MSRIDCADFHKFVDTYIDGEFDDRDRAEFDAHTALCSGCRSRLEQNLAFRTAVRPHLKRPTRMPPALRARICGRLRAAGRPARAARWARRIAFPMPALAAAGAVLLFVTPLTGFAPVVDEVVDQHVQRVPIEVPTPEVDEANAWFRDKLPFEVQAPRFDDPQVMLLGGRLSRVGGARAGFTPRRAAYLVYGVGAHKLTVLVFDGRDLGLAGREGQRMVGGQRISMHDAGGYRVALFERGPLTYAVTSDLPEEQMLRLVSHAR